MRLFALTLLITGLAWSQTGVPQPNCQYKYRFTNRTGESADPPNIIAVAASAGVAPWIDNTAAGCIGWQLQYSSEGFSAISITLQSSIRVFVGQTGGWTNGAASTFSGTDVVSSLPMTSTTGGNYVGYAFFPFMRVNLTSATGTGSVEVVLNGWKSIVFAKGIGAGGGSISTGTTNTIAKYTGTTTLGDSHMTDDGTTISATTQFSLKANPLILEFPNSSTGTTTNKLAKLVNTGGVLQAQIITTSAADQTAALGCVIAGGGTTGTALIMVAGRGSCYFDSATTAGHIAIPSSTSAGALHDTGSASSAATGENMATVGATDACGSPPCLIAGNAFMTPDIFAIGSNGNGGGGGGNGGSKQQLFRYSCAAGTSGGTTVLSAGSLTCPAPNGPSTGTINGWTIYGEAAAAATCSATVDIYKDNAAVPATKISASAPLTLTTANSASGDISSVSTWTKAVAANDAWNATLVTITGCVYLNLQVTYQ